MTLPQLMFKIWDGDPNERFTFMDMNRLGYNANIVAREAGVTQATFVEADRTQQFRYDEIQKLENLTESIALTIGVQVSIERNWGPMRSLTYRDFERVESNLYACYVALGGVGERIADNKFLIVVSATLFPDSWSGNPPFIDLEVPMVRSDAEILAWVPHTATIEQRVSEQAARLSAKITSNRAVRITALGQTPGIALPIRIALGGLSVIENKTLAANGWSGSGPWTQDITLTESPENIVVGLPDEITQAQAKEYMESGIHCSGINDKTVTIRAIYKEPEIAIPIGVLYSTSSVI